MMTHIAPPRDGNWQLAVHSLAWLRLSQPQKAFVCAFVSNGGNAKEATRRAYPAAKKTSISPLTWEILKSPRVRAVLDLYENRANREKIIEAVKANLDVAEKGSVAAQRLLSQLERLVLGAESENPSAPSAAPAPGERPKYAVGEIVRQHGKRFRIEAVELPDLADVEVGK
jgi:hypothetical protein